MERGEEKNSESDIASNFRFPVLARELYGEKYWGVNYNVLALGCPLMTYIFSVQVAARVYQQHVDEGSKDCYGTKCFQTSFWITTGACVLSALLALVLCYRTRALYARKEAKRAGEGEGEIEIHGERK